MLTNANLLVTGGTGSFGHKVAATLAATGNLNSVTIFSRDEKKQHDMRRRYPDFRYIIGDVRDYDAVERAMRGIDIVFHAAALKQVPNCEDFPEEALKTNCLGAINVCKAARHVERVSRVIALSTDKAVMPVNAMGISKALAEKIVVAQPCTLQKNWDDPEGTVLFCCVRYGNVLGTRGSILPLWYAQAKANQPLTVTDASMTRFIMNLKDSVALVQRACGFLSGSGDTFVWKAPALSVGELAELFKQHVGKPDLKVTVTGRRPGEKFHETLVCEDELYRTYDEKEFVVIKRGENVVSPTYKLKAPFTSDAAPKPENFSEMLEEAVKDMEESL